MCLCVFRLWGGGRFEPYYRGCGYSRREVAVAGQCAVGWTPCVWWNIDLHTLDHQRCSLLHWVNTFSCTESFLSKSSVRLRRNLYIVCLSLIHSCSPSQTDTGTERMARGSGQHLPDIIWGCLRGYHYSSRRLQPSAARLRHRLAPTGLERKPWRCSDLYTPV